MPPISDEGYKRANSFKRLLLKKRTPVFPAEAEQTKKSVTNIQQFRLSGVTTAMVLATVQAGGRSQYHPHDVGFGGMKRVVVVGSWRFPPRFQRNIWQTRHHVTWLRYLQQPLT
jgi:hypothetical protein